MNSAMPMLLLTCLVACSQDTAPPANEAEAITALPLKRGYYVASNIPCARASNATISLLRRNGLGGARETFANSGTSGAPGRIPIASRNHAGISKTIYHPKPASSPTPSRTTPVSRRTARMVGHTAPATATRPACHQNGGRMTSAMPWRTALHPYPPCFHDVH